MQQLEGKTELRARKDDIHRTLAMGNIIIYVENVIESTEKLVELRSESTKVQETISVHKMHYISKYVIRK